MINCVHSISCLKLKSQKHKSAVQALFIVGSQLLCSGFNLSTGLSAGALEPPPTAVHNNAAAQNVFVSNLRPMLRTISHQGWEDLGVKTYRIADGRLVSVEPAVAAGNFSAQKSLSSGPADSAASEGGAVSESFSPPVFGNDILILDEFACKAISQKTFKRGSRYITIKAFEFAESEGANAGYDLLRKGSTTVVKRGDGSSEDGDSISFWQDKYLFVLSGSSEDDDESKEVITKFAENLSKIAITHAQPPAVLSRIPVVDRIKGSEKIVMGPLSAAKYYPAPDIAGLSVDSAHSAVVADYQILYPTRERLKLLYIDYGDARFADEVFNTYQARLEQLHPADEIWPEERRVLFKLNKVYLMVQRKPTGRLVVIYGARKARSLMLLAGQIR